jgi:hypothetical protein
MSYAYPRSKFIRIEALVDAHSGKVLAASLSQSYAAPRGDQQQP